MHTDKKTDMKQQRVIYLMPARQQPGAVSQSKHPLILVPGQPAAWPLVQPKLLPTRAAPQEQQAIPSSQFVPNGLLLSPQSVAGSEDAFTPSPVPSPCAYEEVTCSDDYDHQYGSSLLTKTSGNIPSQGVTCSDEDILDAFMDVELPNEGDINLAELELDEEWISALTFDDVNATPQLLDHAELVHEPDSVQSGGTSASPSHFTDANSSLSTSPTLVCVESVHDETPAEPFVCHAKTVSKKSIGKSVSSGRVVQSSAEEKKREANRKAALRYRDKKKKQEDVLLRTVDVARRRHVQASAQLHASLQSLKMLLDVSKTLVHKTAAF